MNPISRGIRNAFRNGIRSVSVILILSLSIGLSLTMLIANRAVTDKIASVKSSIGNTITISPAGFNPGSQANNTLTSSQLAPIKSLPHVTALDETLTDRLSTTGSSQPSFGFGRSGDSSATTSLTSPVKLNMSGEGGGPRVFVNGGGSLPTNFSLPISFVGTNDPAHLDGGTITLNDGKGISGGEDTNNALVSTNMASKNGLKVGSTFTAYDQTLTVSGIFKTNTQSQNDTVLLSLPAEQRLSGQSGAVTSAIVTTDSLDNLSSVTSSIKKTLGSNADVVSAQDEADNTVKPLNSVKTIALFSLIGAVVAGGVIILLTMIMVVRERKHEIGVTKAIGGSSTRIIGEFTVEALTLTIAGAVIGLLIGVAAGQPVTNALVDNSANSSSQTVQGVNGQGARFQRPAMDAGPGRGIGGAFRNNSAARGLHNINAQVGWGIILDGVGAAVLIAVIGSALTAGMISKVRPSEILRSV